MTARGPRPQAGVFVVATGGTIASTVQPDGGVEVAMQGRELLESVPRLRLDDVDVLDLFQGPSWNLDLDRMAAIAVAARDAPAAGVVITHGTDTLEETAFLTDLVAAGARDTKAIVVTGSMRNAGERDGDGPRNLRDAFDVARSPDAQGRGVLVVMAGLVHAARWVTKTDTQSVATFASPGYEPVGHVADGEVRFDASPVPRTTPRRGAGAAPSRVVEGPIAVVASYAPVDEGLIEWHLDRGVRGVVIEGSGAGNVNEALVTGVELARERHVPVVVVSRCATGAVAPIYGGHGGGHTIAELGVMPGGDLSARKARLALAFGLAQVPRPELRAWFAALVG